MHIFCSRFECRCDNSYGKFKVAPLTDCNLNCPGNQNQSCGGLSRNLVWTTGLRLRNVKGLGDGSVVNVTAKFPAPDPVNYLGCFYECGPKGVFDPINGCQRDLSINGTTDEKQTTIDACVSRCFKLGFIFAGLQNG